MSRRVVLLAVTAAALAAPAGANAGGWATVELDSVPFGMGPGERWNVEMTILQHGVTPLDGVHPQVIVQKEGEPEQAFAARPTGEPGVYRASVPFDSAGTWNYKIDDGFSAVHTYAPVTVGKAAGKDAAAAAGEVKASGGGGGKDAAGGEAAARTGAEAAGSGDGGPDLLLAFAVAAAAGLVAAFAAAAFRRRREGPAAAGG